MPVIVRLDAYPDLEMPGKHRAAGADRRARIVFDARARVCSAVVTIDGSNARLLPDLTAAIDVEVERTKGALVVPWSAVTPRRATRPACASARAAASTTRPVTLGPADEVDVVVTSGLTSGQVVLK